MTIMVATVNAFVVLASNLQPTVSMFWAVMYFALIDYLKKDVFFPPTEAQLKFDWPVLLAARLVLRSCPGFQESSKNF